MTPSSTAMPPRAPPMARWCPAFAFSALYLELVPIFRITHGCHPGNARASKRTGSTENAADRATRPAGAVRVNARSEAFHRNTRSASAADAKTFGSRGCVATACRSAMCPCTCAPMVGTSSPSLYSTSQTSHASVPNTNSRGVLPLSLELTRFLPVPGVPIGRQSSARLAGAGSCGYGLLNWNE